LNLVLLSARLPREQRQPRTCSRDAPTPVDREARDDDLLCFKREGGGWPRLNRVFGGELDGVLQQFQREVWAA